MAGADEPADRHERGHRGEDALADDGVAAHQRPLVVVERAGLVEDGRGDRHLADVVQLGRVGDVVEVVRAHPEPATDRGGQVGDAVGVLFEVGLLLVEDLQEKVAAVAARRGAPAVLLGVHPRVGELERLGHGRLVGHAHGPVRAADAEALAFRRERLERPGEHELVVERAVADQRAELVAAEPVGAPVATDGGGEAAPERREQGVAGGMAVGVVVVLEAVEIEQRERRRPRPRQVAHEPAAVAEARQVVGQRLAL